MSTLAWIIGSSLLMSAIALVGSATLVLEEETLQKIILPLVAFAAGNFIYIGAYDLVPEVKEHENLRVSIINFRTFMAGLALMLIIVLLKRGRSTRTSTASCSLRAWRRMAI